MLTADAKDRKVQNSFTSLDNDDILHQLKKEMAQHDLVTEDLAKKPEAPSLASEESKEVLQSDLLVSSQTEKSDTNDAKSDLPVADGDPSRAEVSESQILNSSDQLTESDRLPAQENQSALVPDGEQQSANELEAGSQQALEEAKADPDSNAV